jgi:hypothetical protein
MQRTRPWCSYDRKWWRAGRSAVGLDSKRSVPTISVNAYNLLAMCTHSKCGQLTIFAACSSSVREFRGGSNIFTFASWLKSICFGSRQVFESKYNSHCETDYNIIIGTKQHMFLSMALSHQETNGTCTNSCKKTKTAAGRQSLQADMKCGMHRLRSEI